MRHKFKITPIFLMLFITACQKEVPEITDTNRKIVINGLLATDSLLNLRISQSAYYNVVTSVYECDINNAKSSVYINNSYSDSLHFRNNLSYNDLSFFYPSNYVSRKVYPLPGQEYKIVVKASGYSDATSTTIVPNLVGLDELEYSQILKSPTPYIANTSNVLLICNLSFDDPLKETNYYMISVTKGPHQGYNSPYLRFESNDPIVEEKLSNVNGIYAIALTDKGINGKKVKLKITIDANEIGMPFWDDRPLTDGIPDSTLHKKVIYFKLYSITEEYFRYLHTLNLYKKNYGNPLTEPVMIYSNINGGYGIFAGASVSCDSIIYHY